MSGDPEVRRARYPLWFMQDLLDDGFPWDQSYTTALQTFLRQYTLHDSFLIGLWTTSAGDLLVLIIWELYWVNWKQQRIDFTDADREETPLGYQGYCPEGPLLLMKIPDVYTVEITDPGEGALSMIQDAKSRPLSQEQQVAFADHTGTALPHRQMPDEPLHVTEVAGGVQDGFRIIHPPKVAILCLTAARRVITIPGL